MRKGITPHIEAVIDQVAQRESLKPYILCGGTALAMQIDHRKSEDLDFMMWRTSKSEKPEVEWLRLSPSHLSNSNEFDCPRFVVDWPKIQQELEEKVGAVERFNMLGFDQVEFVVRGVSFSFYVSDLSGYLLARSQ